MGELMKGMTHRSGITGCMGSGKSTLAAQLAETARSCGIPLRVINADETRAEILERRADPVCLELRSALVREFGREIGTARRGINRRRLGDIIFFDPEALKIHDQLVDPVLRDALTLELANLSGLVLVDWALLAEKCALDLVDYNVIYVQCEERTRLQRLLGGDLPNVQVIKRMSNQLSDKEKLEAVRRAQSKAGRGALHIFRNGAGGGGKDAAGILNRLLEDAGIKGENREEAYVRHP